MRAVVITHPGGPEVLQIEDRPQPEPGAGEVRVRVLYAGLNRSDVLQRKGQYPPPPGVPADIPGLEFFGVVDAVGSDVSLWSAGQRVFGLVGGGGYADFIVTHERLLAAVPDNLSDEQAAAVPEVFMTAYDALFLQAGLESGQSVLIHAVGSGVGTAALQLAKAAGCRTFGTARSAEKLARARDYGLDVELPLPNFAEAALSETEGRGVNVLIDFVGGPYLGRNLKALSMKGRLVQVGSMGGLKTEIDLSVLMQKRLHLMGTVLRSRPLEEKILVTRNFEDHVCPLLEQGKVKPVVDRVFAMTDVAEAHRFMEENRNFGKILLKMEA